MQKTQRKKHKKHTKKQQKTTTAEGTEPATLRLAAGVGEKFEFVLFRRQKNIAASLTPDSAALVSTSNFLSANEFCPQPSRKHGLSIHLV
jgi:hypothetical protein